MSNNYIQGHDIEIHDVVIKCVYEHIYWRPKIGACPELEKIK